VSATRASDSVGASINGARVIVLAAGGAHASSFTGAKSLASLSARSSRESQAGGSNQLVDNSLKSAEGRYLRERSGSACGNKVDLVGINEGSNSNSKNYNTSILNTGNNTRESIDVHVIQTVGKQNEDSLNSRSSISVNFLGGQLKTTANASGAS